MVATAMDRGIANALEKLSKALAAVAHDIAQLKLDIASWMRALP
jgi:hypothetical protein